MSITVRIVAIDKYLSSTLNMTLIYYDVHLSPAEEIYGRYFVATPVKV